MVPVVMDTATNRATPIETTWLAWMTRFLSIRSATTPPNSASDTAGTAAVATTRPSSDSLPRQLEHVEAARQHEHLHGAHLEQEANPKVAIRGYAKGVEGALQRGG